MLFSVILGRRARARTLAVIAAIGFVAGLFSAEGWTATQIAPKKQHHWQPVGPYPEGALEARACTDCPAALELACLGAPGSGLLELAIPIAGVANGRERATKQIGVIIDGHVMQRRATTFRRGGLFVPHIALGADDLLFRRLEAADLIEFSFYGQRAYVGVGKRGQRAIHALRAACWPDLDRSRLPAQDTAICTWHVPIGCFPNEPAARSAGRTLAVRTLVTRQETAWCANAVIDDLAAARIFAGQQQTYPRRSCVWVAATSPPQDAASPIVAPALSGQPPLRGAR
jgi:hypothetical protein